MESQGQALVPDSIPSMDAVLPNELWFEIAELLDPSDVLALGQTNKALRHIYSQEDLWIRILQSVCRRYGLFAGTFPFHRMDLLHLQRASLGPERWTRLHQKYGVSPGNLKDAEPLPYAARADHEWLSPLGCHLVPGGRYLVVLMSQGGSNVRIELWDLGVPGNSQPSTAICLASADLDMEEDAALCKMDVAFVNDDVLQVGIIPSVTYSTLVDNRIRTRTLLQILNIRPESTDPSFETMTTLHVKLRCAGWQIFIRAGYLVLYGISHILVYHLERRRLTTWKVPELNHRSPPQIIFTGGCLAVLSQELGVRHTIHIWRVGDIDRRSQLMPTSDMDSSSAHDDFPPDLTATCPFSVHCLAHLWVEQSHTNELLSNSYDSKVSNQSADYVHSICSIDLRLVGEDSSSPSSAHDSGMLTTVGGWTIPPYHPATGDLRLKGAFGIAYRYRMSGFQVAPTHTFFFPLDSVFDSRFGGDTESSVVRVTSVTVLDSYYVSAQCLVSGRILYSMKDDPFEPTTLYLVDYLC